MSLSNKLSIEDVDLKGKRVLIRVDFNVPLDKDKKITNNQRIAGAIPTIKYAIDHGAKAVILMSHLGRPDGAPNPKYSLRPVAERLGELLDREVAFVAEPAAEAQPGDAPVTVLENLRFDPRETSKDAGERRAYAEELARFGDVVRRLAGG